jgi:putative two-component system response regulator
MHLGATEFLLKPIDLDQLEKHIESAREYVAEEQFRRLNEQALAAKVTANEMAISALHKDIRRAYAEALACLAAAAEYKDPETGQHITRIGEYAAVIARSLGWDAERRDMIRLAAPLHDVGKVGMPDAILLKEGPLDAAEMRVMRQHPENGYKILSTSEYPVMVMAARIALSHHERWDGTGYPRGLKGNEIPVEASITTLVDVYDALRSERPYKPGFSHERVVEIITKGDGRTDPKHFRPEVLEAFLNCADDLNKIFLQFADGQEGAPVGRRGL